MRKKQEIENLDSFIAIRVIESLFLKFITKTAGPDDFYRQIFQIFKVQIIATVHKLSRI